MKHRFNKNWQRKSKENFSLGILPFFILILVAFGFKSISPDKHQSFSLRVNTDLPVGERFQKLIYSKPLLHLYIGKPIRYRGSGGWNTRLQINDKISDVKDLHLATIMTNEKWFSRSEKHPVRAELHADKNIKMGLIMDVKRELQKINWVHFNYVQAKRTE